MKAEIEEKELTGHEKAIYNYAFQKGAAKAFSVSIVIVAALFIVMLLFQ